MNKRDVVIIGGGPAGRVIVHMLHTQKSELSVTLIKDEEINVNRCAVPYGLSGTKPIETLCGRQQSATSADCDSLSKSSGSTASSHLPLN